MTHDWLTRAWTSHGSPEDSGASPHHANQYLLGPYNVGRSPYLPGICRPVRYTTVPALQRAALLQNPAPRLAKPPETTSVSSDFCFDDIAIKSKRILLQVGMVHCFCGRWVLGAIRDVDYGRESGLWLFCSLARTQSILGTKQNSSSLTGYELGSQQVPPARTLLNPGDDPTSDRRAHEPTHCRLQGRMPTTAARRHACTSKL
ncbi:hypothetical protein E4U43_005439 [Claviceps pusilla]|uniref:Uncharacterized protein n=1 Tax=Claviceps pusilla TaxID=123648 RepID=A0A9P7N4V3_9HYPO|nr:hypothetical protein E4U43_005439 [Claviceps pusilla]